MSRATILRDMDTLDHHRAHGFYDRELDMWFDDVDAWLKFKYNKTAAEVF